MMSWVSAFNSTVDTLKLMCEHQAYQGVSIIPEDEKVCEHNHEHFQA
jgi:hypothetical protein